MNCPTCGAHFHTTKFHGITIDRCPRCGGIWLGETQLAAIVARDVARRSSQYDPGMSLGGQVIDFGHDWRTAADEDYFDETASGNSYRLQELWGGQSRPED